MSLSKKYDFVLFENAYQIENHYFDLELLAIALKKAGYSVAVANVFKEAQLCKDQDIPHIDLKYRPYKYFSELKTYRSKISSIRYMYLRFLCNIYLIYALFVLRRKSKRIYVGSLTIDTPLLWLLLLPLNNDIYIWGLRSYVIKKWEEKMFSRYGIYSFIQYNIIRHYKRIKLIVSNDIIAKEFADVMKASDSRLVIRPERWIEDDYILPACKEQKDRITFLTIGTLRRNKHVELVLDAFRRCKQNNYEYVIAGRCKDDNGYNEMIEKCSEGLTGIKRIDRYIPDDEYKNIFDKADYIILCDEEEKSCGTNGTMMEALLKGIPVIAPKHEPFISEVEQNHIGLLYNFHNIQSLTECIDRILSGRQLELYTNIKFYINRYRISQVAQTLKEQIVQNEKI